MSLAVIVASGDFGGFSLPTDSADSDPELCALRTDSPTRSRIRQTPSVDLKNSILVSFTVSAMIESVMISPTADINTFFPAGVQKNFFRFFRSRSVSESELELDMVNLCSPKINENKIKQIVFG